MSFTESKFGLKETSIPLSFISFSIIRSNGEASKQAKHENNSDSGKSQKRKDGRTRTDEKAERGTEPLRGRVLRQKFRECAASSHKWKQITDYEAVVRIFS